MEAGARPSELKAAGAEEDGEEEEPDDDLEADEMEAANAFDEVANEMAPDADGSFADVFLQVVEGSFGFFRKKFHNLCSSLGWQEETCQDGQDKDDSHHYRYVKNALFEAATSSDKLATATETGTETGAALLQ